MHSVSMYMLTDRVNSVFMCGVDDTLGIAGISPKLLADKYNMDRDLNTLCWRTKQGI